MQKEFDWTVQQQRASDDHWMPPAGRLFQAIKNNDARAAEAVLAEGFDASSYWIGGKSFLRLAGEESKRGICELLVRCGVDPNEASGKRNYSLLHNAVAAGNYGFASILLSLGAAPSPLSSNKATPLHLAARSGQAYLASRLIEFGADVDAQDSLGRSPLLLAFQKAQAGIAKVLVKKHGNLNLADRTGVTPRMVAESCGPPYSDLIRS